MVSTLANWELERDMALTPDDVYISYLPLPHILERLFVNTMIFYGSSIGFYRGDVLKLKDDL